MREDLDQVRDLLYDWQKRLGLLDWDVEIVDAEPEEGLYASVWRKEEERYAEIRIRKGMQSTQRVRSMVHELLHLLFIPLDRCVTFPTYHDADRYGYEQERLINRMCTVLTGWSFLPDDDE